MLSLEQIDEYIFLYHKQELKPEQLQKLQEWIKSDPKHRSYFQKMLRSYRLVSASQHWDQSSQAKERIWQQLQGRIKHQNYRIIGLRIAGAAAVVLLALGSYFLLNQQQLQTPIEQTVAYYEAGSPKAVLHLASGEEISLNQNTNKQIAELEGVVMRQDSSGCLLVEDEKEIIEEKIQMHTLSIPEGGEYQMVLADGTKVWLNSASELTFPSRFTGERREVILKGEAYFEVESDSLHPFYVVTDQSMVKVLGTSFNVASYASSPNIQVALLQGKVAFSNIGDAMTKAKEVVLKPGEIAQMDRSNGKTTVKEGDVKAIIAWIGGRFNFNNMPLEELVPQLERWYGVKFEFVDEVCKNYRFTGAVTKYRELNYILDMIASMSMVSFREQGGTVLIRKAAEQ